MESIKILTGVLMVCSLTGADHCVSPQYLEKSTTGTIQCSFSSDFISVHWYDTAENLQDIDPILSYEDSSKRGEGFVSGEFDIHPNGSLIINDVNIKHETKFTVTVVVSTTKIPESFVIEVKVTVSPTYPFPLVNTSLLTDEIIQFVELGRDFSLSCNVNGSRPLIPLSWNIMTSDGDLGIPFNNYSINDSGRFSSFATLRYSFSDDEYISVLLCKADDSLMLLDRKETFVLTQNKDINLKSITPALAASQINSMVLLNCSKSKPEVIIWKKTAQGKVFETVAFAASLGRTYTKLFSDDVILNSDGTLIIPDVSIQHEGQYVCLHQNQGTDGIEIHNLSVIVNPSPSYPVFDGCNHDQYCVLEVEREGTLLCSLSGIRPAVTLTLRSHYEDEMISFTRQNMETVEHDDVFDVHLQVWYRIYSKVKDDRITIECSATGENSAYFTSLSTQVDLQFFSGNVTDTKLDERKRARTIWYIMLPGMIVIVVICVAVIITISVRKCHRPAKGKSGRDRKPMEEETGLLLTEKKPKKVDELVQQLKTTYGEICSSVQPVPYETEGLYNVNDLFVDGGLRNVHSNSLERGNNSTHHITYKDIVNIIQEEGSFIIIEGEPGYGKTMYSLQIIYDWFKSVSNTPLGKFQLLIYIPLRDVGINISLSESIKQLLLPKDSTITVSDITDIMLQSKLTLIILDGYDEYIERDKKSDINDIIARKRLHNSSVILTTRSTTLPRQYSGNSKRFMLTGFDHVAQRDYLMKFPKSESLALQSDTDSFMINPIIEDICKVPLVFAVFAKTSRGTETPQKFGAVSFFQLAISSYHYHLRNKDQIDDKTMVEDLPSKWTNNGINKLAFDSLTDKESSYWTRQNLNAKLGEDCVNYFIALGILVVEVKTSTDITVSDSLQKEQWVKFSSEIFSEWYAAHYVVDVISSTNVKTDTNEIDILCNLDPFRQEYLFRFVCGLNAVAADVTIDYLKNIVNGETLAVLCLFERHRDTDTVLKAVNDLCKEVIQIDSCDTKLTKRASIQLLSIASTNKVPITEVSIDDCLQSVDYTNGVIYINYQLRIPNLNTLRKLTISDRRKKFSHEETEGILQFCLTCQTLESLRFENCLMPDKLTLWNLARASFKGLKVLWCPNGTWYRLDELGLWKTDDFGHPMTEAAYQNEENFFLMFSD